MITLTKPYNGKGILLNAGTVITLPGEIEKIMVENGNAEYCFREYETRNNESHEDPYVMKNAKDMAEITMSINDIKELEKLLVYEEQSKNRKTVIDAISERITKLKEEEVNNSENMVASETKDRIEEYDKP